VARHLAPLVEEMLAESPVVVVQGARQVGKSTLVRELMSARGGMVLTLDDANTRAGLAENLDEVGRLRPGGTVAIDEVQLLPELLTAIKVAVDRDRRPGGFLLTGSADLLHVSGAHESLAGRAESVTLWGFSQGEVRGLADDFLTWLDAVEPGEREWPAENYERLITEGSYPEAIKRSDAGRARWFDNYSRAVVDHDAAQVSGLADLSRLDTLLRLMAANTGQEVVLAQIARAAGIPERSLPPYLRLLGDLYLTRSLPPWGRGLARRAVGKPKALVADSGLAAHLMGVSENSFAGFGRREHFGQLLEAFVAAELIRQRDWSATRFRLFHFRDSTGPEVDLVAELPGGNVIGLEVKAASTLRPADFKGLTFLRDRLGEQFKQGAVLYTGTRELRWGDRLRALPISALWSQPALGAA
jgi:predicted AAA+ superfamily ATPase